MRRRFVFAFALTALALACATEPPPSTGVAAQIGGVTVQAGEPPARFAAPLPSTLNAHGYLEWTDANPPSEHVKDKLCAGDSDMWQRVAEVAPKMERAAFTRVYAGAAEYCRPDPLCARLGERIAAEQDPTMLALEWRVAGSNCDALPYAAMFANEPADAALLRLGGYGGNVAAPVWGPAHADAFAVLVADEGTAFEAVAGAVALDAPADVVLAGIDARPADQAETLARALRASDDPKLHARYCKVVGEPCPVEERSYPWDRISKLSAEELASCVTSKDNSDYDAVDCLLALARVDRPKAAELASAANPHGEYYAERAAGMARFPARGDLAKALVAAGLAKAGDPIDPDELDVETALSGAGRLVRFDVETGMYPNHHDSLMRDFARLCAPTLDGAVFDEIPAPETEGGEPVGDYGLQGWLHGRAYTGKASGFLGDWYDVEAAMGLVNAMLETEGSADRLAALYSGDQTLPVICATPEAVAAGEAAGLIHTGKPGAAADAGKAFEDEAIKALLEQEGLGEGEVQRDVRIEVPE